MKKLLAIMIAGLFLIGIVSAVVFIPDNQLITYSDSQIKQFMKNNVQKDKEVIDRDDQKIYFYYTMTTAEPYENETDKGLITKDIQIRGSLTFDEIKWCRDTKGYTKSQCRNNLVENYNQVVTDICLVEDPNTGSCLEYKEITPVYAQLKLKFNEHFNRIVSYKEALTPSVEDFVDNTGTNIPAF